MLLHTESSVLAAIEDPAIREARLGRLRKERGFARVASLLVVIMAFVWAPFSGAPAGEPERALTWLIILLATVVVAVRAETQVNLLMAVDRLEEMVAKRSAAATPDGE